MNLSFRASHVCTSLSQPGWVSRVAAFIYWPAVTAAHWAVPVSLLPFFLALMVTIGYAGYVGSLSFLETILRVLEKLRAVNPDLKYGTPNAL